MYALFIVLNEVNQLDEILERFVKIGVKGATVLDSQGMAGAMMHGPNKNIPLFGSLRTLMDNARPYNKTIFTVLESEELVEQTVSAVQDVLANKVSAGLGFMFSVPIGKVYSMSPKQGR
jgi:nitrogen regulatory protein PII